MSAEAEALLGLLDERLGRQGDRYELDIADGLLGGLS